MCVPLLRSLQAAWPHTRFTWVIGRAEAKLMRLIPDVEFIEVDKREGLGGLRALRGQLRHRRFDVLLHLQHSLRASAVSLCIRADRRIGFPRGEARELQWLFTNETVKPVGRAHVVDSLLAFADALGCARRYDRRAADWTLPLPPEAIARARSLIPGYQSTLVISPCSSHRIAQLVRAALCAGRRSCAARAGHARADLRRPLRCRTRDGGCHPLLFPHRARSISWAQDTLPELLAVLARATALLSPDSGPVHMATLVNTPVIGLYAATPGCAQLDRTVRSTGAWMCTTTAAAQFLGKPATGIALDSQDRAGRRDGPDRRRPGDRTT